jgi:tryptophanyl-tRNA synthetase
MRVLSGIQPTGRPHWGNYFGAIRQYIALQNNEQAFYFVANLHALTSIRDRALLQQHSLDAAIDLLALGLDPNQATLFIQSDVPEVSELCWLLLGTPMGLLERCVFTKIKSRKAFRRSLACLLILSSKQPTSSPMTPMSCLLDWTRLSTSK